jgi:hypothetical protein
LHFLFPFFIWLVCMHVTYDDDFSIAHSYMHWDDQHLASGALFTMWLCLAFAKSLIISYSVECRFVVLSADLVWGCNAHNWPMIKKRTKNLREGVSEPCPISNTHG